jgi:hypothetical protein
MSLDNYTMKLAKTQTSPVELPSQEIRPKIGGKSIQDF